MNSGKILITIDVLKVNKDKIKERRFTTKDGKEVIAKDLNLEIVPLKEPKLIKEGDAWALYKTHFVALEQTQEERQNKVKSLIVGDGRQFLDKGSKVEEKADDVPMDDINPSDIPFN